MAEQGHALYIARILAWHPPGEPSGDPPAIPPARPTVVQALSTLERMKACPHRTSEAGCGCGGLARCLLGKGTDGLVNHADCFACLQAPSVA
jgi:hypothetical protein